jgi:hypothetical protein
MKKFVKNLIDSSVHIVKYLCQVILLGATLAGTILLVFDFVQTIFESPDLVVERLTVSGNKRVTENEILALADIPVGRNILLINLEEIAARLEAHPWVKTSGVQRIPPKRIHISVEERQAVVFSLNPRDNRMYGIDIEGYILPPLMGPSFLKNTESRQEEELQLILSSPLLQGIEIGYVPGIQISDPNVVGCLQFLATLKMEAPEFYPEIVEAQWNEDQTLSLHPKRRIGVIILKELTAGDIGKKMHALWEAMEEHNVHAIYVDARFPAKGFAVLFEDNEAQTWQKLYETKSALLTTAGRSES